MTRQINEKYVLNFSESTAHSYFQTFLLYRSTVTTEALVHLTMGGLAPIYHGGLLGVSVRYYDAEIGRPGLPEDVAALVSAVTADGIVLTLCNLHPLQLRTILVQAGAFGEHSFTSVEYVCGGGIHTLGVEGRWFEAELGPGCKVDLNVGMCRFVNQPSYAVPF